MGLQGGPSGPPHPQLAPPTYAERVKESAKKAAPAMPGAVSAASATTEVYLHCFCMLPLKDEVCNGTTLSGTCVYAIHNRCLVAACPSDMNDVPFLLLALSSSQRKA